jgi:hypothetical protein
MFVLACASWEEPPEEPLLTNLGQILRAYKSTSEGKWREIAASIDRELLARVKDTFRING